MSSTTTTTSPYVGKKVFVRTIHGPGRMYSGILRALDSSVNVVLADAIEEIEEEEDVVQQQQQQSNRPPVMRIPSKMNLCFLRGNNVLYVQPAATKYTVK
eukprot:PhF_6_TR4621/c0_g1_i2/m.6474/K12625/LSM6; U6 snRNA-associated Sm-like protein LSm6